MYMIKQHIHSTAVERIAYDSLGIRVIYEERKDDPDILGFIDIGLNADNAFNEYVADYAKNGYENGGCGGKGNYGLLRRP